MRFDAKRILLRDGREALLRPPADTDAAAMIEYMRVTAGETDFLLRYPEECDMPEEREEAFLRGVLESPDTAMIVCEVEGRMAGNCQLRFNTRIKTAHRASVAIALFREYWGLGIGTAMFGEMIRMARERGVMQLELEVIEGNERAMGLYRRMGFRVAATHPGSIRLRDGTLLDEYLMILPLPRP